MSQQEESSNPTIQCSTGPSPTIQTDPVVDTPPSPTSSQYTYTTCTSWYLEDSRNAYASSSQRSEPDDTSQYSDSTYSQPFCSSQVIPPSPSRSDNLSQISAILPTTSRFSQEMANSSPKIPATAKIISKEMARRAVCESSDSDKTDSSSDEE